jgi:hypothetical protein
MPRSGEKTQKRIGKMRIRIFDITDGKRQSRPLWKCLHVSAISTLGVYYDSTWSECSMDFDCSISRMIVWNSLLIVRTYQSCSDANISLAPPWVSVSGALPG